MRKVSFGGIQTIADLVTYELCVLSIFLLFYFAYRLRRDGLPLKRETVSQVMFLLFASLLFYSQAFSEGRAILSEGIAMPGSLITRSFSIDAAFWLRRAIEPSVWFLLLLVITASNDSLTRIGCIFFFIGAQMLIAAFFLECLVLVPNEFMQTHARANWDWLLLAHFELTQLFLLALLVATIAEVLYLSRPNRIQHGLERLRSDLRLLVPISLALFFLGSVVMWGLSRAGEAPKRIRAGAHYYSWFPENWAGGFAGERFDPPVNPQLGKYTSANPEVFLQHVEWAEEAGIDFLIFDWWPQRPHIGRRIYTHVVRKKRLGGMKFSLMYESLDLREAFDNPVPGETDRVVYLTPKRINRLKKHWEYLAKHYMRDKSYLRIDGRAVLFVYATRHLVGPVADSFRKARAHVKAKTGIDLYIVGDEVFFNVLTYSARHGVLLKPDGVPDWDRLTAFDAITSYNPYDETRIEHAGSAGVEQFFSDVRKLYQRYREIAATVGIRFIPGILPGYNDRGVRLEQDHYVLPRYYGKDAKESFFSQALRDIGLPFLDKDKPFLSITSWNEWNEGTQIEPTSSSLMTNRDTSPSGAAYTRGEYHRGYKSELIKHLANALQSLD